MKVRVATSSVRGQAGVLVLSVACALAHWYWYALPAREGVRARRAKVDASRRDSNRTTDLVHHVPALRAEVAALERQTNALRMASAAEPDTAALLRQIHHAVTGSRLLVRSVAPRPPVRHELHTEWPLALELEGTYHNFATFLDRVGRGPQIVNVTQLQMRPKTNPIPGVTVIVDCVATTFVLTAGAPSALFEDSDASLVLAALDDDAVGSPEVAYEPAVRRDPFVDPRPKRTAPAPPPTIRRPPGFAGVTTAEIALTGTVENGDGYIAIVESPDKRTYIVRPGDRLFDGTIRTITAQAMLIETRAGDAAGVEKGRDVWKVLRQTHEAR